MAKPVHVREGREPYWRQVVARWKRSGLGVSAFCQREGLNQATFYRWRWELQRRGRPQPAVLAPPGRRRQPRPPAGAIEDVLANGRCLRVAAGFDPQTLVRVVELLEGGGHSC